MDVLTQQVKAAQTGDQNAYAYMVHNFQDMAMGYAYALLKDFHLAQDAAQEAFIDAYMHLSQLHEPAAFPGWFRTVIFKHADRIRRKQKPSVPIDAVAEPVDPSLIPDADLEDREIRGQVHAALNSLPDLERQTATLFYISAYSRQQIADFLQVPMKSVIYRLRSARRMLKERMIDMSKQTLQGTAPSRDDVFTQDVMNRLQAIEKLHGSFVDSLSKTFSEEIGKPVTTKIAFRDLTTYAHVSKVMSMMGSLTYTVTMDPLGGDAIFSMFAPVVRSLLKNVGQDQDSFTNTVSIEEGRQMNPVTVKVIDYLQAAWKVFGISLSNAMYETEFDYVNLAKSEDAIIIVGITIEVEGVEKDVLNPTDEQGQDRPAACLCYPLSTLKSILSKIEAA